MTQHYALAMQNEAQDACGTPNDSESNTVNGSKILESLRNQLEIEALIEDCATDFFPDQLSKKQSDGETS